jgi:RNA polymerase sigma-70 factor (ECF subfamily)
MDEPELIKRIQAGDGDAFRHFYEQHVSLVFRYVRARVSDHHEAEDITAEAFVKAWQALPSFKWQGKPLTAWLLRIAYHLIVDKYRRNWRLLGFLPETHAVHEPGFRRVEEQDVIRRAFSALSYEEQVILFLHYLEGQPLNEIADILGKSANAVRTAKFRALRRLQRIVDDRQP